MTRPLDTLIDPGNCVVILDTCSVRALAHEGVCPTWVSSFKDMALNGYSFSLSDVAFAELVEQISRGAINSVCRDRMIERLDEFINQELPVFMGKIDIVAAIGGRHSKPDWSIEEFRDISRTGWLELRNTIESSDKDHAVKGFLQEEREDWVEHFELLTEITKKLNISTNNLHENTDLVLDTAFKVLDKDNKFPEQPFSMRCDLQIKLLWRQFVRMKKKNRAYNPQSTNKKNDGIDFDLYRYLMIPAFVVSNDNGFFVGIDDINSYQVSWFKKPAELSQEWDRGETPRLMWPPIR